MDPAGAAGGTGNSSMVKLIRKFKIQDTFAPNTYSLNFSRDNHRSHRHRPGNVNFDIFGQRVLRRLGKIYCPSMGSTRMVASSSIIPCFAFSDHAPVVARVSLEKAKRRPSHFWMNVAHLACPEFVERIKAL